MNPNYIWIGPFRFPGDKCYKCKKDCAKCCRLKKVYLRDKDIERISNYLRRDDFYDKETKELRKNKNGCVFLKDNKCSIYPIRPYACRAYPYILKKIITKESKKEGLIDLDEQFCPGISKGMPAINKLNYLVNLVNELKSGNNPVGISDEGTYWKLWNNYDEFYIDKGGIQISNDPSIPWAEVVVGLRAYRTSPPGSGWTEYWATDLSWTWSTEVGTGYVKLIGQTKWAANKLILDVEWYLGEDDRLIKVDWKLTNNLRDFDDTQVIVRNRNITVDGNSANDKCYVGTSTPHNTTHRRGAYYDLPADFSHSQSELFENHFCLYDGVTYKRCELYWDDYFYKNTTQYNIDTLTRGDSSLGGTNGIVETRILTGALPKGQAVSSWFKWRDPSPTDYTVSIKVFDSNESTTRSEHTQVNSIVGVGGGGTLVWIYLYSGSTTKVAQRFTKVSKIKNKIYLRLSKAGDPPNNFTVRIETDSADEPSGTLADPALTKTISASSLPTSSEWFEIDFGSEVSLTPSSKYWIVVSYSSGDMWNSVGISYPDDNPTIDFDLMKKYNGSWGAVTGRMLCLLLSESTSALYGIHESFGSTNTLPIADGTFPDTVASLVNDQSTVYRVVFQLMPRGDVWKWAPDGDGSGKFSMVDTVNMAFENSDTSKKDFILTTSYVTQEGTDDSDICCFEESSTERDGTGAKGSNDKEYGDIYFEKVDGYEGDKDYCWDVVTDTITQDYWIYIEFWFTVDDAFVAGTDEPEVEFYCDAEGGQDPLTGLRFKFAITTAVQEVTRLLTSIYDVLAVAIVSKIFSGIHALKNITTKFFTSNHLLKNLATKFFTKIYTSFARVSKEFTSIFSLQTILTVLFTLLFNVKNLISKLLSSSYTLLSRVMKIITSLYSITGQVFKFLTAKFNLKERLSKLFSEIHLLKTLISKITIFIYTLKGSITKIFTGIYSLKELLSKLSTSIYNIKERLSKLFEIKYLLQALLSKILILKYGLSGILSKVFILKHSLKELIPRTFTSYYNVLNKILKQVTGIYSIKSLVTKITTSLYSLKSRLSKFITGIYQLKVNIPRLLTVIYSLKSLVPRILTNLYGIKAKVSKLLTLMYDIVTVTVVTKFLTFIHSLKSLREKLLSSIYLLKNLRTRVMSLIFNSKILITKSITALADLLSRVSKYLTFKYLLKVITPKIFEIKYNTRSTVTRFLSTKFGILARIQKLLTQLYSIALAFYIQEVTATPYKVHREEVESTTLRCDWFDSADLDVSYYKCEFWIRDYQDNIYGPYIGTVVKESANNFYASYDLDPDESFLLGLYDLKAEVTKYG